MDYLLCLFTLNLNNCHLKGVELLHGFGLDLITNVDVGFHGFVVAMASPFHDNLRRDTHAECIADERASASVGADDFVFWLDFVKAFITPIVGDSDRLIESGQLTQFMKIGVHLLVAYHW